MPMKTIGRLPAARLAARHGELTNQALSFTALLEREQLYCDLGSLSHFSYWQTPPQFAMRFDTRFFLAALPPGQTPLATSYEVAHSVWLTPDRAMQLFNRGELPMIFPTFASLRTFSMNQTSALIVQFNFGVDIPHSTAVIGTTEPMVPLRSVWYIGARVIFDWRKYL